MAHFKDTLDFASRARLVLDSAAWAYLAGGAGRGDTITKNREDFGQVRLRPRLAREVCADPQLGITLFGRALKAPVLVAPTSPLRLFHPEAEVAVARAASKAGLVAIVSADCHCPLEDIAAAADGGWWFQLYAYRDQGVVDGMIALAEELGAGALVVTVDACYSARRLVSSKAGFRTPEAVDFHLLRRFGVFEGALPASARFDRLPLTLQDIERIAARSRLPVLVKGILRGDDARAAVSAGAAGVIVSNHGGRQLDGAVSSISALGEVIEAADGAVVLIDSGIRSGGDVVKSLALGAQAACIGRPYVWGLAAAGEAGVSEVLTIILDEVSDTLRQMSVPGVTSLNRADVSVGLAESRGRAL